MLIEQLLNNQRDRTARETARWRHDNKGTPTTDAVNGSGEG